MTESALFRDSSLYGKAIFVVATAETGAERVLRMLACLPGVAVARAPTHLFSQGIRRLGDKWLIGAETSRPQGIGTLISDEEFLSAARELADVSLAAVLHQPDEQWVVEHSVEHIGLMETMQTLYPDAHIVHVVRDGRQVAERLASAAHSDWDRLGDAIGQMPARRPLSWADRDAALRWCEDQAGVLALSDVPSLHIVRIEDLTEEAHGQLEQLAMNFGVDVTEEALVRGADAMGPPLPELPVGRAGAAVEVLGADLLRGFGYAVDDSDDSLRAAVRYEFELEESGEQQ